MKDFFDQEVSAHANLKRSCFTSLANIRNSQAQGRDDEPFLPTAMRVEHLSIFVALAHAPSPRRSLDGAQATEIIYPETDYVKIGSLRCTGLVRPHKT